MISNIDIAYKIGFSSGLDRNTVSAYIEMKKWEFIGGESKRNRLRVAFCGGYKQGLKMSSAVRYELTMMNVLYPDISYCFQSPQCVDSSNVGVPGAGVPGAGSCSYPVGSGAGLVSGSVVNVPGPDPGGGGPAARAGAGAVLVPGSGPDR